MISFPSLEETKLSSILLKLQPEVRQVQADITSISNKYRSDLDNQLQSSLEFEKHLVRNYSRINKKFKITLAHAEDLNVELNKKLDHLKDHDHLQELTEDVMGKLLNVVATLEIQNEFIDPDRFPLLNKVLKKSEDDSFEQVNIRDIEEYESGFHEADSAVQNELAKDEPSLEAHVTNACDEDEFDIDHTQSERVTLDSKEITNDFTHSLSNLNINEAVDNLLDSENQNVEEVQQADTVSIENEDDEQKNEGAELDGLKINNQIESGIQEHVQTENEQQSAVGGADLQDNEQVIDKLSGKLELPAEDIDINQEEITHEGQYLIPQELTSSTVGSTNSVPTTDRSQNELASIEDAITRYKSRKLKFANPIPLPSGPISSAESTGTSQAQAQGFFSNSVSNSSTKLSDNLKRFI